MLNETAEKLEKLEAKTKGGFGKVREDFKKLNESLDQRFAEIQPRENPEADASLKEEMQVAQTQIQEKMQALQA